MKNSREKEFIFPENITSDYGAFLGLTLKEVLYYVLPVVVIGVIVLFLPPHNLTVMMIELIIFILILTIVLAVLTSKPVNGRNNIRLPNHINMKRAYSKRQHLFFLDKKKEIRK